MPQPIRATPSSSSSPRANSPRRVARTRVVLLALAGTLGACAPGMMDGVDTTGGDSAPAADTTPRDCSANPCACADRGPPDYTRAGAGAGQASASADDEGQRAALARANRWRTAAGLAPLNAHEQIAQAATAHANYLATTPPRTCWPNPHNEVESCPGFTGAQMFTRMQAAGYQPQRASEVINWEESPEAAVDAWIWTVYHRQPFMDYRYTEAGLGRVSGTFNGRPAYHTVMDFGAPAGDATRPPPPEQPVVFPVPGQTDVPPSFRGDLEGPTPPAPATTRRWPSGTVVSVHFPNSEWTLTAHRLFRSDAATGACAEVPHTYLSHETDANLNRNNTPANDVFLYGDVPLERGAEYVAQVEGTFNGEPYVRTWAFTTQ